MEHTENETTDEVIAPEGHTVELLGRSYHWPVPFRRIARHMLRRLNRIRQLMASESSVDDMMDGFDAMLDFFFEFNVKMKKDKEKLNNEVDEKMLGEQFGTLSEFISHPFLELGVVRRPTPEDKTTSNSSSTTP